MLKVGTTVTHAYTGDWRGVILSIKVNRSGRTRVRVDWGHGDKRTHDATLLRRI